MWIGSTRPPQEEYQKHCVCFVTNTTLFPLSHKTKILDLSVDNPFQDHRTQSNRVYFFSKYCQPRRTNSEPDGSRRRLRNKLNGWEDLRTQSNRVPLRTQSNIVNHEKKLNQIALDTFFSSTIHTGTDWIKCKLSWTRSHPGTEKNERNNYCDYKHRTESLFRANDSETLWLLCHTSFNVTYHSARLYQLCVIDSSKMRNVMNIKLVSVKNDYWHKLGNGWSEETQIHSSIIRNAFHTETRLFFQEGFFKN